MMSMLVSSKCLLVVMMIATTTMGSRRGRVGVGVMAILSEVSPSLFWRVRWSVVLLRPAALLKETILSSLVVWLALAWSCAIHYAT